MMSEHTRRRGGISIVEMLVVIAVIVFLSGILLAALAAVKGSGEMTKSINRMRQIGVWMQAYSSDNRETVLPSQFDYDGNPYEGKVRTEVTIGNEHEGTWADILWTQNEIGGGLKDPSGTLSSYRYDSPDAEFYKRFPDFSTNPLRSAGVNTTFTPSASTGDDATPYGPGAQEATDPGYFAANDFFNARPDPSDPTVPAGGRWYTRGQITFPDRSMYLVDSYAGETIADEPEPFDNDPTIDPSPLQVDFRYNDVCLMLFLDAHVTPETPWEDLDDLQDNRKIRVQDLDEN